MTGDDEHTHTYTFTHTHAHTIASRQKTKQKKQEKEQCPSSIHDPTEQVTRGVQQSEMSVKLFNLQT